MPDLVAMAALSTFALFFFSPQLEIRGLQNLLKELSVVLEERFLRKRKTIPTNTTSLGTLGDVEKALFLWKCLY